MTNLGTMCSTHKIRTRNKTVLNDQFGNNVFHAQDKNSEQNSPKWPIWEQCVPRTNRNSEQFENNMFRSQLGTRNEMFLFYTRVNVLCLSCKKPGPLIVNRNTKTRNSRYQRNVPFQISEHPTKLKTSEKSRQKFKWKLRIVQAKRLGEMEVFFKIWWSLLRSKAGQRAMIKFWET